MIELCGSTICFPADAVWQEYCALAVLSATPRIVNTRALVTEQEEPVAPRPDTPRRLWQFLRRYKDMALAAIIGTIATVLLVMLLPLSAKLVIDKAIPDRNIGLFAGVAVGLFLLQVCRLAIGYGHNYLIHYVGQRVVFDIRKALFHHLQLLHLAFYEKRKSASLVNRVIHDAVVIQQFINSAFTALANSFVLLIIALAIMAWLSSSVTLFCLLTLPVYFAIIHPFKKRLKSQHHEVKERQSLLAGNLGEFFSGIRVVKSFAQEDHERRRFVLAIGSNL